MSVRFVQRWAERRRLGRAAFVRKYGVLGWGVSFGVLGSVAFVFIGSRAGLFPASHIPLMLPFMLVIAVPLSMAAGYGWGTAMWFALELRYARLTGALAEPAMPTGMPDARPPYRTMAAILCVVELAAVMLFGIWYVRGHNILWALFALVSVPYAIGFGHLALTGRWLIGRNYRL